MKLPGPDKKLTDKMKLRERRRFIRHPVSYPLQYRVKSVRSSERSRTLNISEGGLLFLSRKPVKKGARLILNLPFEDKVFRIEARVMHCKLDVETSLFSVGVAFYRISDAIKVKLLEQIYLIDEYRHLRSIQLGREVSLQEASQEWIKLYSKQFKRLYW